MVWERGSWIIQMRQAGGSMCSTGETFLWCGRVSEGQTESGKWVSVPFRAEPLVARDHMPVLTVRSRSMPHDCILGL